ncbi:MAG: hypothetical protein ACKO66_06550 [Flavobacteriales bacterium]
MKQTFSAFLILAWIFAPSCIYVTAPNEGDKPSGAVEKQEVKTEEEDYKEDKGIEDEEAGDAAPQGDDLSSFVSNAIVTGQDVNMRAEPSINAKRVASLDRNARVRIETEQSPEGNGREAILKAKTDFYNTSTGQKVFSLNSGRAVNVLGRANDYQWNISFQEKGGQTGFATVNESQVEFISGDTWYYINTEDGKRGWVLNKFIQRTAESK